jgi:2-polyprenyl-3-methyl-5-hydroxy-6-metoxy-1,4-benzoquinol methylase
MIEKAFLSDIYNEVRIFPRPNFKSIFLFIKNQFKFGRGLILKKKSRIYRGCGVGHAGDLEREKLARHLMRISESNEEDFRWRSLRSLVKSYVRGVRVLDVGCGTGHMALDLLKAGYEVTAIDISPQLVNFSRSLIAREGFEADVRILDLLDIKKLNKKFDTIICLDVIEHMENDDLAIKKMSEVLEPRGRLIISVPAFKFLYGLRDKELGHFRRYEREEIRRKLLCASLDIIELRYWNFIGFIPFIFFEKVLKRKIYEGMRYSGDPISKIINACLSLYFDKIERRFRLPFGLTLLIVCERKP